MTSLLLLQLILMSTNPCNSTPPKSVEFGTQEIGSFVRVDPASRSVGDLTVPLDFLAKEAGTKAVFIGRIAGPQPARSTWQGADPLLVAKQLVHDFGLVLTETPGGWWLVSAPFERRDVAVEVMAEPADPRQVMDRSCESAAEVIEAVAAFLPSRTIDEAGEGVRLATKYVWLAPSEPDNVLLVVERQHLMASYGPACTAYKVRLIQESGKPRFTCLWQNGAVFGSLNPLVAVDFDGDGVRDFVFTPQLGSRSAADGYVVLSGIDGHMLMEIEGSTLEMARDDRGRAVVVAEKFFTGESRSDDRWHRVILTFDEDSRVFRRKSLELKAAGASASPAVPGDRGMSTAVALREAGARGEVTKLYVGLESDRSQPNASTRLSGCARRVLFSRSVTVP